MREGGDAACLPRSRDGLRFGELARPVRGGLFPSRCGERAAGRLLGLSRPRSTEDPGDPPPPPPSRLGRLSRGGEKPSASASGSGLRRCKARGGERPPAAVSAGRDLRNGIVIERKGRVERTERPDSILGGCEEGWQSVRAGRYSAGQSLSRPGVGTRV